jgi:hypothetical protein
MSGETRHEELGAAIRQAAETIHAPATLRATLAEQQERRGRRTSRVTRMRLAAAGAIAAALAVVVVLTTGATPRVQDVAAAALQAPERPGPAEVDDRFIAAEIAGIRFPYWEDGWGWKAVGARTDTVAGRRALTVIYARKGRGVHYTVVEGEPLKVPASAKRIRVDGWRAAILRQGDADVVVWERNGHTCILASTMVSGERMARFIPW